MWQSTTTTTTLRRYDVVDRRSYDGKFVTTVPPEDKTTDDDEEHEGQQHTQGEIGEIDATAREREVRDDAEIHARGGDDQREIIRER